MTRSSDENRSGKFGDNSCLCVIRRAAGKGSFRRLLIPTVFVLLLCPADTSCRNLKDPRNQADYIIVAPASYFPIVEKLARFRRRNNGFSTMIVDVDTIMVQFGKTVSPDTAMRSFIRYSLTNWCDPKPGFFVLAGNINAVPSHPERESISYSASITGLAVTDTTLMIDQWFVQYFDSSITMRVGASIGRLPAWDSSGLSVMVDKTIQYEENQGGSWCSRAVSLSDYKESDGDVFESEAAQMNANLAPIWPDTVSVSIRADSPYHLDPTGFINLWNQGAALLIYLGHANNVLFSNSHYFSTYSVDSLANADRLPVCLLGGCDLNFQSRPETSIPTHLLEQKGGGAVAVIASDGLMYWGLASWFYDIMVESMVKRPEAPIGISYDSAMSFLGWPICRRLTFLGDPALTVKHFARGAEMARRHASFPLDFQLEQNYPNPFNPSTAVSFKLPAVSNVSLKVYDVLGREVRTLVNAKKSAGTYHVGFDAGGLPSGVYFYRLIARPVSGLKGCYTAVKKMMKLN